MDFTNAHAKGLRVDARPTDLPMQDTPATRPQAAPWAWAAWSTRARLVAVVLLIDALAALVSCGVIVLNARTAVRVETRASLATVESLVADTIRLSESTPAETLLQTLDLRFKVLRHVRVAVLDNAGERVGRPASTHRTEREAPRWFADLIKPPIERHTLPITVNGQQLGTAQITTQPLDEIDEIWGYARALSLTTAAINVAMLLALYIALGRILAPLRRLGAGLTQLEHHDYTARLEPPGAQELAVIAERFNKVAAALGEVRGANGRLNRQLLTAQDDERRRTALELHDEFGPCLFALEANAASIARIASGPTDPSREKLAARAAEISAIVGQVQTVNRELLNRLRPHGLGQAPLATCLDLLLRGFAQRHPGLAFVGRFDGLARGYGDLVDLTVFRCVQESATNAVRHGAATRVEAEVVEAQGRLAVTIRDNGTGILGTDAPTEHGTGLGLSGMRERVEALGGTFALDNAGPGAIVRIMIPVPPDRGEENNAPSA
ncbi:two-component system, NarL family, sensor histidine kinase UhpB [Methylobacterium phyllostachyos]|uniref:Oxygen sensor histidine kinase NreB n=2 Tax=Methylobacterium phyllostachyos TaxID=582672 RepID=A0A1G9X764_9HYPH|nr:ATP-binding protein [Methylobacterium phyllostachyos]SDM92175.1 two-component system, NarL family, sensor histidine kinase UhpB [Methylobacterium phyllostachyos]